MKPQSPSSFKPQLTVDRLQIVSNWLLEELYATEDDLSRPTDNGYTRGCTAFGRQRSRLMSEAVSGEHPWLGLCNGGNDLVFSIGDVPCRFSNDDPSNPSKDAVLIPNRYQLDFMEFAVPGEPVRFCFIIDRGYNGAAEPRVEFLGFTATNEVACRWVSDAVRVLHVEGAQPLAPSIPVAKPQVGPKRRDSDQGNGAAEAVQ